MPLAEIKTTDGTRMHINPKHVVSMLPDPDGGVAVELISGTVLSVDAEYERLRSIISEGC